MLFFFSRNDFSKVGFIFQWRAEVPFFSVEGFIFRWAGAHWVGISSNEVVWKKFMEKGRSPEALILFALILLSLISNIPMTWRQISRKQIDRKLKKRKKRQNNNSKSKFLVPYLSSSGPDFKYFSARKMRHKFWELTMIWVPHFHRPLPTKYDASYKYYGILMVLQPKKHAWQVY